LFILIVEQRIFQMFMVQNTTSVAKMEIELQRKYQNDKI